MILFRVKKDKPQMTANNNNKSAAKQQHSPAVHLINKYLQAGIICAVGGSRTGKLKDSEELYDVMTDT